MSTETPCSVQSYHDIDPVEHRRCSTGAFEGSIPVEQMGRLSKLSSGELVVMDLQRPALIRWSADSHSLAIEVPHNLVPFNVADMPDAAATPLRGQLVDCTIDLAQSFPHLDTQISVEQAFESGSALVDMIRS